MTTTDSKSELDALKLALDEKNAEVARLVRRDVRQGTGPSAEYRAAYRAALAAYHSYWAAVDAKGGAK